MLVSHLLRAASSPFQENKKSGAPGAAQGASDVDLFPTGKKPRVDPREGKESEARAEGKC